jgi:putative peptidoglycan lipid II flippase
MPERHRDCNVNAPGTPVPASGSAVERQVVRALGSIGAATLASRILGFGRDMVVALAFGAGPITDAFFVAYRIPNILRRLLAEGAFSTAVIPVLSDYFVNRSREESLRMLRVVLGTTLAVVTATVALGMVFSPWLVRIMAPGFADAGQGPLAVMLTRALFPYLLLVAVAAYGMGVLNAHGRFFAAALGPAVFNLGMIVGVVLLRGHVDPPILSLVIGVLAGGLGQVLVQVPAMRRLGLFVAPAFAVRHPALGRIARLLLPSVFGLAAVQVTVFVNTLLASLLAAGSISYLYYADRVMEFPLGIFGIALASASLPAMSRQAASGDLRGVANTLSFTLGLGAFIAVPATVGLVMLRTPITRVLFERGQFGAAETAATAEALLWYALGLAAFSCARITGQVFYAIGQPSVAVGSGILAVACNVVAAFLLMGPLGHGGLAAASSVGAVVNFVSLLWLARRRFGRVGGRALVTSLARTLAASVPLAAWCALAMSRWPHAAAQVVQTMWLIGTIAGGALVFWLAAAVLRAPERTALVRMLPGARRRPSMAQE